MKKLILLATLAAFTALPAQAQDAISGSASQANNTANQVSASGAISTGNVLNLPAQPSTTTVRQDGTATLKTAPALGSIALGGGHPCALTPVSAQLSIIGGGFGAGGMEIDEACMLMIMGASTGSAQMYNAGLYMIAARDADACKALYIAGLVSDCTDKKGRSTVMAANMGPTLSSNSGAASAPVQVGYSKCDYDRASNKLTIKYKAGANKDVAQAACLATHGF